MEKVPVDGHGSGQHVGENAKLLGWTYRVDMKKAVHWSSKFFLSPLITNCSPQGLVASLLFRFVNAAEEIDEQIVNAEAEDEDCVAGNQVRQAIMTKRYSMRSFLTWLLTGKSDSLNLKGTNK